MADTRITPTLDLTVGGQSKSALKAGQIQVSANGLLDAATGEAYAGISTTTSSSTAELNFNDGSIAGTAVASKTAVLGANKELDEFHTTALYLGAGAGTLVTATAAELNQLHSTLLPVTTALVNTAASAITTLATYSTTPVLAGVSGKTFTPTDVKMRANGGNVATATVVSLLETTSNAVVFSATAASLTSGQWVSVATAGAIGTQIGVAGTANKSLFLKATSGTVGTATSIDVIVTGFWA